MIKQIPNLITLCNLVCGCLSIQYSLNKNIEMASWMILLATIFDFFDGFAARLLKADGELGKQLDSLCDVVSFGVAPGIIWYQLLQMNDMCNTDGFCINKYVWLAIPLGAAFRLAKFNIDTRQKTGFIGVPVPITGIMLAGISLALQHHSFGEVIYKNFYVLLLLPIFTAFMAISELPMLAMKFKKKDPENVFKILFLGLSLLSIVFLKWDAFAIIYVLFLVVSIIATFALRKKTNHG